MKIVLTLCSANYLAHAKTMADSLVEHNPDYQVVIGLVDRVPTTLESSFWQPHELIPVEDLSIAALPEMVQNYDIVELNTAVKPFYMEFLYRRNKDVKAVLYIDPDIVVYSSLEPLLTKLQSHDIIVTPHSCTYDNSQMNIYYEIGMLATGVYNLGFLATARSDTTFKFLQWWQKRLQDFCYLDPARGLFVDQLWVTLAPVYFPEIYVEKHLGYNMSYWNHFERQLSFRDGRYYVNSEYDLFFYHFSSYSPDHPDLVTKRSKSRPTTFAERPDLKPIYDDYRTRLLARGYASVKVYKYALRQNPPKAKVTMKTATMQSARRVLRTLPGSLQYSLKRLAEFTINTFK